MKLFYLAAIAATLAISASAQAQSKKLDTIFFENFNQKSLDRSKWNVEITGNTVNQEQQAYVDSASTTYLLNNAAEEGATNGALVLKALYHPGYMSKENKKYDFLSGRINTQHKMEFTYCTFTCRMKMASGA